MPSNATLNRDGTTVKLFLSHATEDKVDFVRPLADALRNEGYEVWYDEFVLAVGDRLLESINKGLRECDYGVVVFSPAFFAKKWTKNELDGLSALETAEEKLILPIWKDIEKADMVREAPIFAERIAAISSEGVSKVVERLGQSISLAEKVSSFSPEESVKARFANFARQDKAIRHNAQALSSVEGSNLVRNAVEESFNRVVAIAVEMSGDGHAGFQLKARRHQDGFGASVIVTAPGNLHFRARVGMLAMNGASNARLMLAGTQIILDDFGHQIGNSSLFEEELSPFIGLDNTVFWRKSGAEISSSQFPAYFMDLIVAQMESIAAERGVKFQGA